MHFTRALTRLPGSNFALGLTQSTGAAGPDLGVALKQHASYEAALRRCGLAVTTLGADLSFPDGTFVEDTAVVTPEWAITTIPGAAARAGEVSVIATALRGFFKDQIIQSIRSPGTLDGGDICEADKHFFIGLSHRTNPEGARQLAAMLTSLGHTSSTIDICTSPTLLHLKTGIAYLGDNRLVLSEELSARAEFSRFERIVVAPNESYAANCVRVNDYVLVARGYPQLLTALSERGYRPIELEMSEFQRMDGGLSCLSLRC